MTNSDLAPSQAKESTNSINATMKPWVAILFTVGLLISTVLISDFINFDLAGLMIIATSVWAVFDSSRIELKRYRSYIAHGPIVLFLALGLFWIICFPWYLAMRYKIKRGTAALRTEAEEAIERKGAALQAKCVALFLAIGVGAGWFWVGWPYGVGFGAIGGLIIGVLIGGAFAIVIRNRSRVGHQPASVLEKSC